MNALEIVFAVSMVAWFISEFLYKNILKSGETDRKGKDRSTLNVLWIAIPFSIISAVTLSYYTKFPIAHDIWILYLGEALILIGIIVRFIIIRSLGKYFTVDVTIRKDHTIKKEGFYSYRIKIEEAALIEQFGEEYLEYRRKTRKLIPFIY
ncbi:Isoprenylcysteine carboxyl methyltransferase [Corchorus olitorius]|uniref:Protein-S-isoprenylcysteine O-methyltransferase n=1 Tax=Corchorus olitorius TaxID=93759 RepID=A0A1R3L0W5_9ROSI|nr:Isoprenylcysteine carboxyl methyltransferase [Corchorus olitorius]